MDYLVYQGHLHQGHWLHKMVRALDDEELTIEVINETHLAQFQGLWRWVNVRFCEAYRITLGGDTVEIHQDAFYQGHAHGEVIIMPKGDSSAQVLTQLCAYRNEFDEFQQAVYEADSNAFTAFVVANTSIDPAQALKRLLPDFQGCPPLYGKTFTLALDDQGKIERAMMVLKDLNIV